MATPASLTLPDGQTFEWLGISVDYSSTPNWLVGGGSRLATLYEQFARSGGQGDDSGDGFRQSAYLGMGAGIHTITLDFRSWTGEASEWGDRDADSDADPLTKLQVLDRALNNQTIDSRSPATWSHKEYSTAGRFGPIPVVVGETNLQFDRETSVSGFSGRLQLLEAADVSEAIDSLDRRG